MNNYCDRCGAQGKTRFVKDGKDLVFCGHHTNEYSFGLIATGFEIEINETADELVSA